MHTAPTRIHGGFDLHRRRLTWLAGIALLATILLLVRHDVFQSGDSTPLTKGSGVAATNTRQLESFTAVELAGANAVVIHVGGKQSIAVHGDQNLLRFVTTDVRNGRLVIGTSRSFSTVAPMRVDVTVPALDAISLSASGRVNVSGIDAKLLTVTVGGSGAVYGQGRADRVDATLTGSGNLELRRLRALDAHAVVFGSGQIWVYATRSVHASVPGTGAILYSGDPAHVTQTVSGIGAVIAK